MSQPDVTGAAVAEGQANRQAARDATYADRPDQYNQYGNLTWQQENVIDPATGEYTTKWTQRQQLSPDMQEYYDSQMGQNLDRANMSQGMMGRVSAEMGKPMDWQKFGDQQGLEYSSKQLANASKGIGDPMMFQPPSNTPQAPPSPPQAGGMMGGGQTQSGTSADDMYARSTRRLDPQFEQAAEANEIALRNKGLRPGDQAYDAAMQNFNMGKNDAYEMARLSASTESERATQLAWNRGFQDTGQNWGMQTDQFGMGLAGNQQGWSQQRDNFGGMMGQQNQLWNQQMEGTNFANTLRANTMQEDIGKRQFSLNEADKLNPQNNMGNLKQNTG